MIAQADSIHIPLADKSVHCCVSSPPYWGLRKYAGEQGRIWGGDPECEHSWQQRARKEKSGGQNEWSQSRYFYGDQAAVVPEGNDATCRKCNAWYGSLGLEPTPEQHIENIVEICREVRRVLRDDGVFWINYGDCYYNHRPGAGSALPSQTLAGGISGKGGDKREQPDFVPRRANKQEIGSGSLMMMPHRVALALQQDGWIVRQDLVWSKPNPMPESLAGTRWVKHRIKEERSKHATDHNIKGGTEAMLRDASIHQGINEDWVPEYVDCPGCEKCIPDDGLVLKRGSWRHTRAHEYVFMLVKGMQYWSNQEAVRETQSATSIKRYEHDFNRVGKGIRDDGASHEKGAGTESIRPNSSGRNPRSVLDIPTDEREWAGSYEEQGSIVSEDWKTNPSKKVGKSTRRYSPLGGANPRSVLNIPTAPYKGAHYATFPPNLIAPLIRATCPRWACPVCGQGWAAVVEHRTSTSRQNSGYLAESGRNDGGGGRHGSFTDAATNVLGYRPTCSCCKICAAEGLTPSEMEKYHAAQRSRNSSPVSKRIQAQEISHRSDLSGKGQGKKSKVSGELPEMQQVIRGETQDSQVLQPEMFSEMDVGEPKGKQVHTHGEGNISLPKKEREDSSGASGDHGTTSGKTTTGQRDDPSRQSGPERQPDRKSANRDKERTRTYPHEIEPFPIEETKPGIVFDPFCGSGTSVMVAKSLLRRGIGIDISMEYLDQQAKIRIGSGTPSNALDDLPLFQISD